MCRYLAESTEVVVRMGRKAPHFMGSRFVTYDRREDNTYQTAYTI